MTKQQHAKFIEIYDDYCSGGLGPFDRGSFKAGFCGAWAYLTGAEKRNDKRVRKLIENSCNKSSLSSKKLDKKKRKKCISK